MTSLSRFGRSSVIASPTKKLLFPLIILLIGAYFRIGGLARDSLFFADEALFSSYARQMVMGNDWLLYDAPTDKPPTTYILIGLSMRVWGESELAARIPNVFASMIGLAAFYALAKRLNQQAAALALLLYALSPLDISYAATAFQDPPMLACVLMGAWFAVRQRWGPTGWALGLALAIKPTAIWVVPLVVGMGWAAGAGEVIPQGWARSRHHTLTFLSGLLIPIGLVALWDMPRGAPSLFTLGSRNNNPGRFVRADEVIPRVETWLHIGSQTVGQAWLGIILLIVAMLWLGVMAHRPTRLGLSAWLITGFLVWYGGLHWLIAFSTWDRYVLLVAPFALLIASQGLAWVVGYWRKGMPILMLAISVVSWTSALHATQRPADIIGIDHLANTLNQKYAGSEIYDNWLGWYLQWYLGREPAVDALYFPTPEDLAAYLKAEHKSGYLVAPDAATAQPWLVILERVGVESELTDRQGDFVVYYLGLATK